MEIKRLYDAEFDAGTIFRLRLLITMEQFQPVMQMKLSVFCDEQWYNVYPPQKGLIVVDKLNAFKSIVNIKHFEQIAEENDREADELYEFFSEDVLQEFIDYVDQIKYGSWN